MTSAIKITTVWSSVHVHTDPGFDVWLFKFWQKGIFKVFLLKIMGYNNQKGHTLISWMHSSLIRSKLSPVLQRMGSHCHANNRTNCYVISNQWYSVKNTELNVLYNYCDQILLIGTKHSWAFVYGIQLSSVVRYWPDLSKIQDSGRAERIFVFINFLCRFIRISQDRILNQDFNNDFFHPDVSAYLIRGSDCALRYYEAV